MKFLFTATILLFSIAEVQAQTTPAPDTLMVRNVIFGKVEIETGVDEAKWKSLLETHMVPVINKAAKKLRAGSYTISVRFLKEKDGSITEVKALNDPGYGLAEGAAKVVRNWSSASGPRWINPSEIDSTKVRSYHTQTISFQVQK